MHIPGNISWQRQSASILYGTPGKYGMLKILRALTSVRVQMIGD
jgi:hypothetical protein